MRRSGGCSRRIGQWPLFLAMSGIWGSSYFFIKIALTTFDPYALVAVRMAIAASALGLTLCVWRVRERHAPRTYLRLAALSLVNITVPFTMLTWAQQYVATSVTSVLSSTTPLFVFVIAALALTEERFSLARALTVLVAFGGVCLLAAGGAAGRSSVLAEGVIVASSAIFAAGNVAGRRAMRHVHPIIWAFAQSLFAFGFQLPVVALFGGVPGRVGGRALLAVGWLGVAGSAVTYILYFHFIRTWGSTRTSVNTYLQPVVGISLGVVALGERLTPRAIAGLGVVAGGVWAFAIVSRRTAAGPAWPAPTSRFGNHETVSSPTLDPRMRVRIRSCIRNTPHGFRVADGGAKRLEPGNRTPHRGVDMYYFGYCTWLDPAELAKYFPEARLVTRAVARNWKVEFRAAGDRRDRGWCHLNNIGAAFGSDTLGLVFEVEDARLKDDFDDFDIVYLTVHGDDGNAYDCFTYVLSDPGVPMRPPNYYWSHVPRGLRAMDFPARYIEHVEQTYADALACPDADRPAPSANPGKAADTR
jgi:drug/metabolite transporter (DMT)-like permease